MDANSFAMWLNGYVELGGERPSEAQWQMIKEHLSLVFKKVTNPLMSLSLKPTSSDISYCFSGGVVNPIKIATSETDFSIPDYANKIDFSQGNLGQGVYFNNSTIDWNQIKKGNKVEIKIPNGFQYYNSGDSICFDKISQFLTC